MDGQRPEGLADAFWNEKEKKVDLPALITAHNDTKAAHDRLVGAGAKAPKEAGEYFESDLVEDGHMRLPEGEIPKVRAIYPDGVPTDDPLLTTMSESALKRGMSKDQFMGFVGDFLVAQEATLPDAIDFEKEMGILGDRGHDMVDEYNGWVDSMKTEGLLNDQDVLLMREFGSTAAEINTLRKIMSRAQGHSNNNPSIITGDVVGEGLPSYEEWYAQIPSSKDNPTAADWEKWDAQGEKLFGTGPGGSSRPGLGMPGSQGAVRQQAT